MAVAERFEHPLIDQAMAYHEMRDALESEFFGRWVVICDSELQGDYETYQAAATAAQERGLDVLNCLIRQVGVEPPIILSYGR